MLLVPAFELKAGNVKKEKEEIYQKEIPRKGNTFCKS